MSRNISLLSSRMGLEENLFEQIRRLGSPNGSAEVEGLEGLAHRALVGAAPLVGAASSYDFLRRENTGKKAYVCNGSACLVAGTQGRVREQLREHFADEEIGEICCLGRCHEAGAFHCAGRNYSGDTGAALAALDLREAGDNADDYPTGTNLDQPFLMTEARTWATWADHLRSFLDGGPDAILAEIERSRLCGRGGAAFPAATKWAACRDVEGGSKYVVCNADEGDPGAYTDRYLMERRPALAVVGMIIAGYVVRAERGVFYIRCEYPDSVACTRKAIEEAREAGLLGERVCGTNYAFDIDVVEGAGAYVCGEEMAMLASIEGQRPEVRVRPPYPAEEGLYRKPTLVQNIETLACVPPILLRGGEAFAAMGSGHSTGSKLVSLDSNFNRPGCYEIAMGTPFTAVLGDFGGGFRVPCKAVHVGGPLGGLVPRDRFADLTLDFESFAEHGFLLGHAGMIAIPETFPVIQYLEHLFAFTAHESCGKCFPCRLGSVRGRELCHKARDEDLKIDRRLFDDLLETMELASLCALGGGVPLPVRNALEHFADELAPYFTNGAG